MNKTLVTTIIIAVVIVIALFTLQANNLSLPAIVQQLQDEVNAKPVLIGLIFFVVYVVSTAVSIPGATLLTLAAGALFGVMWGTILVSFASTIGATIAFLFARVIFRHRVQAKFANQLSAINKGIEEEGGYYLFSLRLVPLFPFFLINLLMGLSTLKTSSYYWISQLGMLPATIIYVNAGAQASDINAVEDLLSPTIILSFVLLGVFPLIAKRSIAWWHARS